jgi:uncharacterized membrane protein
METFVQEIVVERPRVAVFDQLTHFEEYPRFLESAEDVQQTGDRLRWRARLGPIEREYEARITALDPPTCVSWQVDENDMHEIGEITLADAGSERTNVRVVLSYQVDSLVLKAADAIDAIDRRLQGDLERLKAYLEQA